jgi:RNA polymerase sigma factor (TIGR02999 family)
MSDVTQILSKIEKGDPVAAEQLLPLVYDELRKMAAAKLSKEIPGQTLSATALVHEAYVRLVGNEKGHQWDGRGHFFAAAAEAMRRILLMNARRRQAEKHGGRLRRIDFDSALLPGADRDDRLLMLDEALEAFEKKHPEKARLVKLRFFAGLTNAQAASMLGISDTTADRYWAYARAWLQRAMMLDGLPNLS